MSVSTLVLGNANVLASIFEYCNVDEMLDIRCLDSTIRNASKSCLRVWLNRGRHLIDEILQVWSPKWRLAHTLRNQFQATTPCTFDKCRGPEYQRGKCVACVLCEDKQDTLTTIRDHYRDFDLILCYLKRWRYSLWWRTRVERGVPW